MRIQVDKAKLATATISIVGRYTGLTLLNDIAELAGAFGFSPKAEAATVEDQARDLVAMALADAFIRTVERAAKHRPSERDHQDAISRAQAALPEQIELSPEMFANASAHPAIRHIEPAFKTTLAICGVPAERQSSWIQPLRENFVIALDGEFRTGRTKSDPPRYHLLDAYFRPTPADEQATRARNWQRYRHRLIHDVRQPLLNFALDDPHAVSLEQVYVPLRCWFDRPGKGEVGEPVTERVFTWLDGRIKDWLAAGDRADAFRLISGEMGCGKSSFARMLAADLARANKPVLLVPLHRLGGRTGDTLRDVGAYAEHPDRLGHDLLTTGAIRDYDPGQGLGPLLLIFDGLDELTTLEGSAARSAREFVAELCRLIQTLNDGSLRVRALFVGRPLAVQDVTLVRQPGNRLQVLRFRYDPEAELEEVAQSIDDDGARRLRGAREPAITARYEPEDEKDALTADQAEQWWRGYQHATRQSPTGVPERWQGDDVPRAIQDLLAQPLLNFLVAIVPQGDEATSVNDLYRRLFDDLYDRETGTGAYRGRPPKSEALVRLTKDEFQEVLQHIAVAAWHHGDRTVRTEDIETCLVQLRREDLKDRISEVGSGLGTILNSFFVEARRDDRPDAYDFTHKSFREYLTARFLRSLIEDIADQLDQPLQRRRRYGLEEAAEEWREATAAVPWDVDLQTFFVDEIRIWEAKDRVGLVHAKDVLCRVFDPVLDAGLPVSDRMDRTHTVLQQSANTEAAFIAALGACHHVLRAWLVGDGPSGAPAGEAAPTPDHADRDANHLCRLPTLAGSSRQGAADQAVTDRPLFRLLCRLRARADHQEAMLIRYAVAVIDGAQIQAPARWGTGALSYGVAVTPLDLTGWYLRGADLRGANLRGAKLERAKLEYADLRGANLRGAKLWGAKLERAKLEYADLEGADLRNANLEGANLRGADLRNANLEYADLEGADLEGADLRNANLEGADLEGADLRDADLWNADLRGANLTNAKVDANRPEGINLDGAFGVPEAWLRDGEGQRD